MLTYIALLNLTLCVGYFHAPKYVKVDARKDK